MGTRDGSLVPGYLALGTRDGSLVPGYLALGTRDGSLVPGYLALGTRDGSLGSPQANGSRISPSLLILREDFIYMYLFGPPSKLYGICTSTPSRSPLVGT